MEADQAELLTFAATHDNCLLRVIAIDQSLPETKLVERFRELLRKSGIRGENTRRGKIKVAAALDDLGCYRLSRLSASARSDAMLEAGYIRLAKKISTAKKRAVGRLRRLHYVE